MLGKHCNIELLPRSNSHLLPLLRDRVALHSPGYIGTHTVDQACLKLRDLPAPVS